MQGVKFKLLVSKFSRMRTLYSLCLVLVSMQIGWSQLQDGSIAPDFTLTDIEGNQHHLYSYLNQGKTVILDFSAAWCPLCWNYHQTGALETFYQLYGPDGTDEAMVLFIEKDPAMGMDDLLGLTSASEGNWIEGTSYPIIDNSSINAQYRPDALPTIYGIHPDSTLEWFANAAGLPGADELYEFVQSFDGGGGQILLSYQVENEISPSCPGFNDGSVFISVTGPGESYTYNWSDGSTEEDLQNVTAGTYTCTIIDNLGNELVTDPIILEDPEPLLLSLLVTTPTTSESNDGRIVAQVEGGAQPYFYTWQDGFTGPVLDDVGEGDYKLTITDNKGCTIADSVTILLPNCSVVLAVNTSPASCDDSFDGQVNILVDGAVPPIIYEWNNGDSTQNITNLPPGAYEVTVTDSRGCAAKTTGVVELSDIQDPLIRAKDFVTVYLDEDGQYVLDPVLLDNGSSDNCQILDFAASQDTFECADLGIQTISFSVIDANFNLSSTLVNIEVRDTLPPFYLCDEFASVKSCDGVVTYDRPQIVDNCPNGSTESFTGIGSGGVFPEGTSLEQYTYTDADGQQAMCTVAVTVADRVSAAVEVTDVSCQGANDGIASVTIQNTNRQYNFQWSDGQTTPTAINLAPGVYSVTVSDTTECTFEETITIGEPASIFIRLDSIILRGPNQSQVHITPFGGAPPFTYRWIRDSDGMSVAVGEDPILDFGEYTLQLIDDSDCVNEQFKVLVNLSTSVNELNQGGLVKVFPNPTQESITIEVSDRITGIGRLELFNIQGQRISLINLQSVPSQQVNLRELTAGMYYLRVILDDKTGIFPVYKED